MKITEHFKLSEFTRSDTAEKKGIKNEPNQEHIANLTLLCQRLLEPLRVKYGEPFIISSGYRCQELNKEVGGVMTSQHTKGQAADVRVREPKKLLNLLMDMDLDFDQAILYPTFLHLSYDKERNRKQVLTAKGAKL